jgi:hypothetical protein
MEREVYPKVIILYQMFEGRSIYTMKTRDSLVVCVVLIKSGGETKYYHEIMMRFLRKIIMTMDLL